jgi:hypothetical protein
MSLNNDDIKQLIAILQRGLTDDSKHTDPDIKPNTKSKRKRTQDTSAKKKRGVVESDASYNKFDAMPEHSMHRDDSRIDQLLIKYPPTQRSREFEYIDVVCRVCGRKESVNPVLVHDAPNRYKCNKCAKVPG